MSAHNNQYNRAQQTNLGGSACCEKPKDTPKRERSLSLDDLLNGEFDISSVMQRAREIAAYHCNKGQRDADKNRELEAALLSITAQQASEELAKLLGVEPKSEAAAETIEPKSAAALPTAADLTGESPGSGEIASLPPMYGMDEEDNEQTRVGITFPAGTAPHQVPDNAEDIEATELQENENYVDLLSEKLSDHAFETMSGSEATQDTCGAPNSSVPAQPIHEPENAEAIHDIVFLEEIEDESSDLS